MVFPLSDVERTRIVPVLTYALIAVNIAVYIAQVQLGESFTYAFAATPYELTHNEDIAGPVMMTIPAAAGRGVGVGMVTVAIPHQATGIPVYLTLLTSLFLHASPLHLLGNLLYLWIFGDNVEEVLGTIRFGVLYLVCGVVGTMAQTAVAPDSVLPTLGASGAIAGVMGAYLVWFPMHRIRVLVFYFITEMPALLVIGLWIAMQVALGMGSLDHVGETGGVAYLAHLGGAAVGLLVGLIWKDRAREESAFVPY